ncbi:permease [Euryarchaeota archaeon ex4484_162]|nr:MAG: permease [Euryarchaeota archaeon ex4484_162]RLB81007.1 MAG: permease [Deltaproteobacteria bacterium]RLF28083.1 MAG: permease [Thermoplasmata archaeon]
MSFYKAFKSFISAFPVLLGVILLLGLFKTFVSPQMITSVFTGEPLRDTLIGSSLGSILTGNPITSYVIGGELLKDGVSLFAVTAFIVAWVTVGIVQLPAEAAILGKRFAVVRNGFSFLFAILVSIATVLTIEVVI